MSINYRELCVELFGTDDVDELKEIAGNIKLKNPRNAGRKKKFQEEDIHEMKLLQEEGLTINEIAKRYCTSRQVISRYLNDKPEDGYTLRMTYMHHQHPCTVIDVDFMEQKVRIQNRTKKILLRAFGILEQPTWEDFEYFLKDRCFPETRGNIKEILEELQLTSYDPLQILEKTRGKMADDDMWLKFQYYPRGGGSQ